MAQVPVGFYTDTSVCIGCKACQVACHQWNELPADLAEQPGEGSAGQTRPLTGASYDNTGSLTANNWRHVKFIEQFSQDRNEAAWLMMSDVCKHCVNAPCLEVCPTGAIIRTEFDSVYIQEPACNGCRNCVTACPFGVIHMAGRENEGAGTAKKCTLCYDRLQHNLVPACAQACPTESIQFGPIAELKTRAEARLTQLQGEGFTRARLYGADDQVLGGLNAFYLLLDEPEVYGLPSDPKLPSSAVPPSSAFSIITALLVALAALFSFRRRNEDGEDEGPAASAATD
ncbi:MAG TPA: 4Fe-4S dicluster domain-containing protein [Chloroflexaceae bacterium]|nr:4Fe-4S dicluster domain-containing protein [Chloroflexaceae bacterium]